MAEARFQAGRVLHRPWRISPAEQSIPCPWLPSLALSSIPQLGILWSTCTAHVPGQPSQLWPGGPVSHPGSRGTCSPGSLPRETVDFMECGHLSVLSAVALLSRAPREGSSGAGEPGGVPRIPQLHPSPSGCPPSSKASGFVQLAEQSRDPSESEIIEGENSGLKRDREEERRIWSWSDGLSHLYRLRLRQKESGLDGKSAAPPRSPGRAFQLVPNKHSSEGRNGAWRAPFPSPGLLCMVGSACTSFIVILPLI